MALVNKPFKRLLVGAAFRLRSYGNICIKQTETEYKMVGQYSDGIFQIEPVAKVWVDSHQLKNGGNAGRIWRRLMNDEHPDF